MLILIISEKYLKKKKKKKKNRGVTRTELFLRKILKTMPRIAFQIGTTLKGKNFLPEGANSYL